MIRAICGGRVQKGAQQLGDSCFLTHAYGSSINFRARACVAASIKRSARCGHPALLETAAFPGAMAARDGADAEPPPKRTRVSIEPCPRECQRRGTATPHMLHWNLETLPMLPPAMLDVPGSMETGENNEAQRDLGSGTGRADRRPTPVD